MRNNRVIGIFLVGMILTFSDCFMAHAQQTVTTVGTTWQSTTKGLRGKLKAMYWIDGCVVSTYKNGRLIIRAEHTLIGIGEAPLIQVISIGKDESDKPFKHSSFYVRYKTNKGKIDVMPVTIEESEYSDFFALYYQQAAHSLPLEVRKMFLGFYNIE
jgi:hypothetical protein